MVGAASASAEEGVAADAAPEPALLDVTVNGQHGDEPAEFLRGPTGALFVSAAFLRAWRIRIPPAGAIHREGETYYPVAAMPTLRVSVADAEQSVAITADASAFERQDATLGGADIMEMTPPSSGPYAGYNLFVEHVRGETAAAGLFDGGVFTRAGAGTASFVASAGDDRAQLTRLETTWTVDRPDHMTSIRIGDAISAAGPGAAPVRFAGVQFARNFAVQPGYLTMPLPVASGSAAVPSVVDLYVNSTLQGQQQVAPGPFELSNIPVPSGGGTVQLVVRDLLGREVVSQQAYYASALLLRRGLHDFSYEAGFLREAYGRRSNQYGTFFVSTTHRYGFTDRLTGEATAQAGESRQMAGASLSAIVLDAAQVGGSAAISHSDNGTGFRAAASLERHASGLSFGLLGDYTSAFYSVLGVSDDKRPPRYSVQAFADMPLPRGAMGVNFLHRAMRDGDDETIAGVFGSFQVTPRAAIQLYANRSVIGERRTSVGAHLALAIGPGRSASTSVDSSRGRTAGYVSYQQDPPSGPGDGFRATARLGESSGGEATYVRNLSAATLTAQASYARGAGGVRVSASGAFGFMGGRGFASRSLGESFATLRLDGFPGVHVFADNQPVGVTGADGFIVIPGLRPFDRNVIRIEQADLPLEATLASEEVEIRPFARAGTIIRFPVHRERGVLMTVRLEDGASLPAGALVSAEAGGNEFVAVSGGEVYAPGLTGMVTLTARWAGRECRFILTVPEGEDPQPRVDGLICRRSPDYAAR